MMRRSGTDNTMTLSRPGSERVNAASVFHQNDRLDLHRMLLAFPEFRASASPVWAQVREAPVSVQDAWREILAEPIARADDDAY